MVKLELSPKNSELYKRTVHHYSKLRSQVRLSAKGDKVVLVTSSKSKEGKTTTSLNLAISLSQVGYKVIIIDTNFNNSNFTSYLRAPYQVDGLSDYLLEKASLSDIVNYTNIEKVMAITAGSDVKDPLRLLMSQQLQDLLNLLKQLYDYVIIDAPIVSENQTYHTIANLSQISLLVVESGKSHPSEINDTIARMKKIEGSRFLGIVLNRSDMILSSEKEDMEENVKFRRSRLS